jgi:protein SCO1/2
MKHSTFQIFIRTTCLLAAVVLLFTLPASAQLTGPLDKPRMEVAPDELKNIGLDEHLNAQLPLDASFVDDTNHAVKLGDYFTGKKPVVLQLGYYGCPMLCDLISRGATSSLKQVPLTAGTDFEVVFISIDPKEDWTLAQGKKRSYVTEYDRAGSAGGWHFLTGREAQIKQVAKAVGFNYKWVASAGQFSHPAGLILCTPEGKISRYLYGVKFDEKTLRLSLVEASEGKVGTTTDRFLLTCFQYDGHQGKYAFVAMSLMRWGGALTLIVLTSVLIWLFRRDARRKALEIDDDATTHGVHAA